MKKILITAALATMMATPAMAIEVYNNDEKELKVDVYGSVRGFLGYGLGYHDKTTNANGTETLSGVDRSHNLLYNLQNNTRIGTKVQIGGFLAHFELGANEKTILSQKTSDTVGLRLAYGSYSFGEGHKFFFGKLNTPTSMGGFISDAIDTDGGLHGFGGSATGTRRWQVGYGYKGFTIALIEPENGGRLGTYNNDTMGNNTQQSIAPRIALSYEHKSDGLMAKIAASYEMHNFKIQDASWREIHAFNVLAGVKPTFMDGKMWVSAVAKYSMNEDLFGESKVVQNDGKFAHTSVNLGGILENAKEGSKINNLGIGAIALEFGYQFMEQLAFVAGLGYQAAFIDEPSDEKPYTLHSVGAFIQLPYSPIKYVKIIPEIATYNTISNTELGNDTDVSGRNLSLIAGVQMQVNF